MVNAEKSKSGQGQSPILLLDCIHLEPCLHSCQLQGNNQSTLPQTLDFTDSRIFHQINSSKTPQHSFLSVSLSRHYVTGTWMSSFQQDAETDDRAYQEAIVKATRILFPEPGNSSKLVSPEFSKHLPEKPVATNRLKSLRLS